jgi:hypothetical protein
MPPKPLFIFWGLVLLLCASVSVGGILVAAHLRRPSLGGYGGALGVALAFLMLFLRRDYGKIAYELRTKRIPKLGELIESLDGGQAERLGESNSASATHGDIPQLKQQVAELAREIKGVLDLIEVNADAQKIQTRLLAAGSVIATLAWGFGDMAACWLMTRCFLCS